MDCIGKSPIPVSVAEDGSSKVSDENNKRRKTNSEGSNCDWSFLLKYQKKCKIEFDQSAKTDTNSILFQHLHEILFSFHLLHEDLKLDISMKSQTEQLSKVSHKFMCIFILF